METPMAESFIDFLEQYGDMRPPEMPYVPGSDYDAWKEQFRSALVSLRGAVPDRVEPNMEVLDEVTESDHVRQTVRISVSEFSNLIAYLLLPTQPLEGRAVVASHGHTKNGIEMAPARPSMARKRAGRTRAGPAAKKMAERSPTTKRPMKTMRAAFLRMSPWYLTTSSGPASRLKGRFSRRAVP